MKSFLANFSSVSRPKTSVFIHRNEFIRPFDKHNRLGLSRSFVFSSIFMCSHRVSIFPLFENGTRVLHHRTTENAIRGIFLRNGNSFKSRGASSNTKTQSPKEVPLNGEKVRERQRAKKFHLNLVM